MRFPYLANAADIVTVWSRMVTQYERDHELLTVHIEDWTLDASTTVSTLAEPKLRPTSVVTFTPKTANAATGLTALYIDTPTQGAVNVNHASNAQTDRIYRVAIQGT